MYTLSYTSCREPSGTLVLNLCITLRQRDRGRKDFFFPKKISWIYLFMNFLDFTVSAPSKTSKLRLGMNYALAEAETRPLRGQGAARARACSKTPRCDKPAPPQEAHHSTSSVPEGETASHTLIQPACQSKSHIHSVRHKRPTHTHTHTV